MTATFDGSIPSGAVRETYTLRVETVYKLSVHNCFPLGGYGGIGRRIGLKIRGHLITCRVGSTPTTRIMKTYEIFKNDELNIAELIQQRRYQLLIHSCIYYELNQNIISDMKWDEWAKELKSLQEQYPEISSQVTLYEYFKDWDASTGAFLPIKEDWVIKKACSILGKKPPEKKKKIKKKGRLF